MNEFLLAQKWRKSLTNSLNWPQSPLCRNQPVSKSLSSSLCEFSKNTSRYLSLGPQISPFNIPCAKIHDKQWEDLFKSICAKGYNCALQMMRFFFSKALIQVHERRTPCWGGLQTNDRQNGFRAGAPRWPTLHKYRPYYTPRSCLVLDRQPTSNASYLVSKWTRYHRDEVF